MREMFYIRRKKIEERKNGGEGRGRKEKENEQKKERLCVTHFMFHSLLFSGTVIFSLHKRHTSAIF